jgi:hypothetical protein
MPAKPSERTELSSWKEIAAYLGVSVRTAQHWERNRGLPVRRLAGEKGRVCIEVAVAEKAIVPEAVELLVFYYLNRRLELTNVLVNSYFKALHRELEAAGQLDHPLTDREIAELRNLRYLKRLGP